MFVKIGSFQSQSRPISHIIIFNDQAGECQILQKTNFCYKIKKKCH